jgi:hypothetical protein
MFALLGGPALAALGAGAAALVTLLLFGWRGSLVAAAAGALFLGGGLAGDLLVHGDTEEERSMLTSRMMLAPDPLTGARLHDLEDAEKGNRWHQVAVGGQGLLVTGLAGACFGLWRRGQRDAHTELMVGAIERAAAWPMGQSASPSLWNHPPAQQIPAPARYRRIA